MYKVVIISLLIFFNGACTLPNRSDSEEMRKIVKASEIKRVTEEELIVLISEQGAELASVLEIANCEEAKIKTDSLKAKFGISISEISLEDYEPSNQIELQVLEALKYSLEQGEKLRATPQKLSDLEYGYYFDVNSGCFEESQLFKASFTKSVLISQLGN